MRFRFESGLPHQDAAVDAVCDLFAGQDLGRTAFTVARGDPDAPELALDMGHGNRLRLLDDEVLANLRGVQARHGLALSDTLDLAHLDFTVEMETGTGKTYVYLRTVFELNRRYGWTKFVVVVPSVAIREGVAKSLEMTAAHFRTLYAGVPMDWFVYDSAKLGQVRDFATSAGIKVMVATIGALNKAGDPKAGNVFYRPHEKVGGDRPVDLVRATRPVVIIDEPQSVEGAGDTAGRKALRAMDPLCRLRYSATHLNDYHKVYRLDAFDAHARGLVKQIVVAGLEVTGGHNTPYLRFLGVRTGKGRAPEAQVEVDVQQAGGVKRQTVWVAAGADLHHDVTKRALYADHRIGQIEANPPCLELQVPGNVLWLQPGEVYGDAHADDTQQLMIRQTIAEHFDREVALKPMGIKVLSLFFVDHVASYRVYAADGTTSLGPLGEVFEVEYRRLAAHPKYRTLFATVAADAGTAHDGYFSRDKGGRNVETEANLGGEPRNAAAREAAERGYALIMKEKERLLDEAVPLRFIFSHSALREGWDNPNVFQICVLRSMGGERQRRQTIGRGLRLCVDGRTGDRRRDEGLNVLTVIADEDFASFAQGLQTEMERDLRITFGVVEAGSFAGLSYLAADGSAQPVGMAESQALFRHLEGAGLIDAKGRVQDALRDAVAAGTLALPARFEPFAAVIRQHIARLVARLPVRDAAKRVPVGINDQVYESNDFRALWERISARSTYRLAFDPAVLIDAAAAEIAQMPAVARAQATFTRAAIAVERTGLAPQVLSTTAPAPLAVNAASLPDILGTLQDRTGLIRRSLVAILTKSGRLAEFRANPAAFIEAAAAAIGRAKRRCLVDGVTYERRGDGAVFAQGLFRTGEMKADLAAAIEVKRGVMQHVVVASTVEADFARDLDRSDAVQVFAKLPGWFKVPTPLGTYNPDWAILVEMGTASRLYLVVETKGTAIASLLSQPEQDKITCGRRHFEAIALSLDVPRYGKATSLHEVLAGLPAPP